MLSKEKSNTILSDVIREIGFLEEDFIMDEFSSEKVRIKSITNSIFFTLFHIGIGPKTPFRIKTGEETWADFMPEETDDLEAIKEYVFAKARLLFDPPQSSVLLDYLKQTVSELEWRLYNHNGNY